MSDFRKITDKVTVSGQVTLEDIDAAAAAGFTTIICNRPDAEEPGQLSLAEIEPRIAQHGMTFVHQPIISGQFTPEDGEQFGTLVDSSDGPVLAYCRSGTRCCFLWAMSQAGKRPGGEIIEMAAAAGYDVSPLGGYLNRD